jgi:hypothetical protein
VASPDGVADVTPAETAPIELAAAAGGPAMANTSAAIAAVTTPRPAG